MYTLCRACIARWLCFLPIDTCLSLTSKLIQSYIVYLVWKQSNKPQSIPFYKVYSSKALIPVSWNYVMILNTFCGIIYVSHSLEPCESQSYSTSNQDPNYVQHYLILQTSLKPFGWCYFVNLFMFSVVWVSAYNKCIIAMSITRQQNPFVFSVKYLLHSRSHLFFIFVEYFVLMHSANMFHLLEVFYAFHRYKQNYTPVLN